MRTNTELATGCEPLTYNEAILSSEELLWIEAIQTELRTMEANQVWREVSKDATLNRDPKQRAIRPNWTFKIKRNSDVVPGILNIYSLTMSDVKLILENCVQPALGSIII